MSQAFPSLDDLQPALLLKAAKQGGHTVAAVNGYSPMTDRRDAEVILFAGTLHACLDFMRQRIEVNGREPVAPPPAKPIRQPERCWPT